MKDFKEEVFDKDKLLKIVNEESVLNKKHRYNNDSIEDLKINYPDKIEKLEETLLNYMREKDLEILKTESPDKWKNLTEKKDIHMNISIVLMIMKNLLTI